MLEPPDSDYLLLESGELVKRAQNGDHYCFQLLVERYDPLLRKLVRERVQDESTVEDYCQEIRTRAWQHLSSIKTPSLFRWWYCKVATNYVNDQYRKSHVPVEALGEEIVTSLSSIQFHPEEIAIAHDLFARAWSELTDKLSEKQVDVFRLHLYYEGCK